MFNIFVVIAFLLLFSGYFSIKTSLLYILLCICYVDVEKSII